MMMTKEEAAAAMNGCEYGQEGSKEFWATLRQNRLVAVFGYSDDCTELRGAIDDELGTDTVLIDRDGLVKNECDDDDCPYWKRLKGADGIAKIEPINDGGDVDGVEYTFRFETMIPHATFKVMENDELYCFGIVFSLDDLKGEI